MTLLVDCGLFILIWMVQIIVYPAFLYTRGSQLIQWHKKYKGRIFVFVFPLMTAQLLGHLSLFWLGNSQLHLICLLFIAISWIVTFYKEVPLHNLISMDQYQPGTIRDLINWNYPRSFAWTIVFILNLIIYSSK
ncbi:hypothetical protein [Fulvivirga lutea]|uniref:Uncharacterized protein n=1 Tax=Fulvivirga lutea TaxID=2810512 RepID=A0A974WI40_9BACT|nr:hypothetical protein [Fulvivirga lutea]QSE96545.1 hypothetical protein JR347_13165 [Fulvivirga lutea]